MAESNRPVRLRRSAIGCSRRSRRLDRRRGRGTIALLNAELLHEARHVQPKRFELLQQIEHDRRTRLRETAQTRAAAIGRSVTLIDHHQLVDVAERRRDGAEDAAGRGEDRRQLLEHGLQTSGLVEFLPRFGLAENRGRFGDALRLDRFRLGEPDRLDLRGLGSTFRFDRRGAAGAFLPQLLLLRFGERDERGAPSFGLENRGLLRRPRRARWPPGDPLPPA